METLGKRIEDALNSAGVNGYILSIEGKYVTDTITIGRPVLDSNGKPALFMDEDGNVDSFAEVFEEFAVGVDPMLKNL